ncbi:MAG: hypothetical protein ACLQFR_19355 [Streptosporangiaceae bacterium]
MLKHTKRLLTAGSIAAAATAIAVAGSAVSLASPRSGSPTTLRLLAHGGSLTVVNVTHSKAFPRTGDELILVQPVYAAAHPGKVIGHGFATATFVTPKISPPAGIRDEVTLVLTQGDIELAGVTAGQSSTLAVTGGTGIYQNARGEATVTTGPGKGNPASITLTLLP